MQRVLRPRRASLGPALVILLAVMLRPAPLDAQGARTVTPSRLPAPSSARWTGCFANLTVGGPQRVAMDWAYGRESRPDGIGPTDQDLQCTWVSLRAGLGAGALGIGYHRYYGPLGTMLFGQVAALRTFQSPNGGTPDALYVGVEGGGSYLVGISPRIGYFVRTGAGSAPRGLFTWGVGFGF